MTRKSAAEALLTRDRIVRRAIAMSSVEGLEGLTIGRLAADLGMSKAGVLGHFGTKEALQLAALHGATEVFNRTVWEPASGEEPGLKRLRAVCETWTGYLVAERDVFPGGCLFTTAANEFDARQGPVREAVGRLLRIWQRRLSAEARTAVEAGDLPQDSDPDQLVFELCGILLILNQEIQLFANESEAMPRARAAVARLLGRGE